MADKDKGLEGAFQARSQEERAAALSRANVMAGFICSCDAKDCPRVGRVADGIIFAERAIERSRDEMWRAAWARCGHFQEMTACVGDCPLRGLIQGNASESEPKERI